MEALTLSRNLNPVPSPHTLTFHDIPCHQYKACLKAEDLLCTRCLIRKRNHYCIQAECPKKKLLCVVCDCEDPQGEHYTHAVAYVLPLLTNKISRNIEDVFEGLDSFKSLVETEIVKIQSYICSLRGISHIITGMLDRLGLEKEDRRLQVFEQAMSHVLKEKPLHSMKLDDIFKNINFITNQECKMKADAFKKQLLGEINNLTWIPDPQKLLRDALLEKDEASPPRSEYVFSVTKPIEVSEIDSQFREYFQLLTDKMKYNPIIIRLENEYASKTKLYEVLIYHFRKCRKLTILNAGLNQIKTPLSFRNLRELDFICNPDCESYTLRLEGFSEVTSLKLKKLKEEDARFLKSLRTNLPKLKELHLEFVNKFDMGINKDLVEFFAGDDENIRRLVLKLRTESEVKRVYGHFTKFLREVGEIVMNQATLQQVMIGYLNRHRNQLTKLSLEGVKVTNQERFLQTLSTMPLLFEFRVSQMQNGEVREIERRGMRTRKAMTVLQRVYKRSIQHRCSQDLLNNIISRSIWN